MPQLHRNNAAEWVMLIAIAPFVWIARLVAQGRRERRASREPSGSAAGSKLKPVAPARKVMIEGLPPRTMN
jgi:hypothetical protein